MILSLIIATDNLLLFLSSTIEEFQYRLRINFRNEAERFAMIMLFGRKSGKLSIMPGPAPGACGMMTN